MSNIKMTSDQLQNEILLIAHHVEDCLKAINENDKGYCEKGLKDINEVIDRLKGFLNIKSKKEFERINEPFTESLNKALNAIK